MVYYIVEGDIFQIPQITNYAHGCNCVGAMGKGIALQIKARFPEMYEQYKALCKDSKYNVGDVFKYQYNDGFIYNLGTQKTWWEKAEMEYIEKSLQNMMTIAEEDGVREIAMPAIGAGLGGGDWSKIRKLIDVAAAKHPSVDLYVVEKYKNILTNICYVKKRWEEENILFYLHFVGENAVRQIEIHPDKTIFLSTEHSICGEYSLYDQRLSMLDLISEDFITREEFENVWYIRDIKYE